MIRLIRSLVEWCHGLMACGVIGSVVIPWEELAHSAPSSSSEEVEEGVSSIPESSEARLYAFIQNGPIDRDDSAELAKVFCLKADHGGPCMLRCSTSGIACGSIIRHPYKAAGGTGQLFGCNDLNLGWMCSYAFPNGDSCHITHGSPFPDTCTYTGND